MAVAGLAWTLDDYTPVGHDKKWPGPPPLHWRCRCTLIPIVQSAAPATDLRFAQWLQTKSEAEQEAILGPARFALWKQGKLKLDAFTDQDHRPLRLDQLRRPPADTSPLRTALRATERKIATLPKEEAHIFAADGTLLGRYEGEEGDVTFTPALLKTFKDRILTHNHPYPSVLSPGDIGLAIDGDLAEMRATMHLGGSLKGHHVTFNMRRGPQGWPQKSGDDVVHEWKQVLGDVITDLEKARLDLDDELLQTKYAGHEALRRLGERHGFEAQMTLHLPGGSDRPLTLADLPALRDKTLR
jgi:hypothetical protein